MKFKKYLNKNFFYIFYTLIILYVMISFSYNEYYTERYMGLFLTVIEMIKKGEINLDFAPLSNFFDLGYKDYSYLPTIYQEAIYSISSYPFLISLSIIIYNITNIDVSNLFVFPIGAILLPTVCLLIVKKIGKYPDNYLWMLFFLLYMIYSNGYGPFYVAPFTLYLQLLLIVVVDKILKKYNIVNIFITGLIFFSIINYWHTPATYFFYFFLFVFIILKIFIMSKKFLYIKSEIERYDKNYSPLMLFLIIIYVLFVKFWSINWSIVPVYEYLSEFMSRLLLKFLGQVIITNPYAYNYKDLFIGKIYFINTIWTLFLSCIIFLIPFLYILKNINKKPMHINTSFLIISLSIILTQILSVVLYSISSSIGFSLLPIYLPFLSLSLLKNTGSRKMNSLLTCIIILLCVSSLVSSIISESTNNLGNRSEIKYAEIDTSQMWFKNYSYNYNAYLDFNLIGKFAQKGVGERYFRDYKNLSTLEYTFLVNDAIVDNYHVNQYILLDHKTMKLGLPINIYENRFLFKSDLYKISNSLSQNKLYEDMRISIYQFL